MICSIFFPLFVLFSRDLHGLHFLRRHHRRKIAFCGGEACGNNDHTQHDSKNTQQASLFSSLFSFLCSSDSFRRWPSGLISVCPARSVLCWSSVCAFRASVLSVIQSVHPPNVNLMMKSVNFFRSSLPAVLILIILTGSGQYRKASRFPAGQPLSAH